MTTTLKSFLQGLALLMVTGIAYAGTDECFAHAAQRRHINVTLLHAIARVESNYQPYATNIKTHAIGEMQILPWHLKWLRQYGISAQDLYDACTNINVGAFILADFIRMYGNTWRAVGAYGAGIAPDREQARIGYARLVEGVYDRMSRERVGLAAVVAARRVVRRDVVVRPMMVAQE